MNIHERRWQRRRAFEPLQRGSILTEYIAVLLGMVVIWLGIEALLNLIQEHHDEFSWALQLPF